MGREAAPGVGFGGLGSGNLSLVPLPCLARRQGPLTSDTCVCARSTLSSLMTAGSGKAKGKQMQGGEAP